MIDAGRDAAAHPAAAPADEPSWLTLARTLLADLVGAARERLHLVALEGQQFVHAAGKLLAFGVLAALLVVTAWFVVIAALVALLVELGLPLAAALFAGAALNVAGAAFAWGGMRRQLASMGFPATLRALSLTPSSRASAGSAEGDAPPRAAAALRADAHREGATP